MELKFSGGAQTLEFSAHESSWSKPLEAVCGVRVTTYLFLWATIHIDMGSTESIQTGAWRFFARGHAETLRAKILRLALRPLAEMEKETLKFLASDRYLRSSDMARFKCSLEDQFKATFAKLKALVNHRYSPKNAPLIADLKHRFSRIRDAQDPKSKLMLNRNKKFVSTELETYREFFDQVEKTPLTIEQRHAAVAFEDRNLLVAAAGSGKSSTLVGKAGYAIHRGLFKPEEIIALAFNKQAAMELNERIKLRIGPWLKGKTVKAHTFHGLGYGIVRKLARQQGRKISLAKPDSIKPHLQAVLEQRVQQSTAFAQDWALFVSVCRAPVPADDAFESLADYERYVEHQRLARRNGQPAAFQTLTGETVRSAQELAIANWLYINGVPFEYERPFSPVPDEWSKYEPDFYLPQINVWYEHFALDAQGKAPAHFRGYAANAELKRRWMRQHAAGRFIETRSHQYYEKVLFSDLEKMLRSFGQPLRPRPAKDVLSRLRALGQTDASDLVVNILNLVKSNDVSRDDFSKCMDSVEDRFRSGLFSRVFWPLHDAYNARLRRKRRVDFNDMIIQAAAALESGSVQVPYKLMLIDEFQDLSIGRARLINAMLAQHQDSVLFGVGDDWQAINGFAGSDLRLFMDFEAHFGATHEGKLTKTFRCPQGIADVSALFIQQNKAGQKSKSVDSELDPRVDGVVELLDASEAELGGKICDKLETLAAQQRAEFAQRPDADKYTVFLLSRYGLEKTRGIDESWLNAVQLTHNDAFKIEFLTMHSSKGLEADYVFLLGLNAGRGLTFPSTMSSDPLVDSLLQNNDPFPHAEERRLFYVALTRAKRQCFVLYQQNRPSSFVQELMGPMYRKMVINRVAENAVPCPACTYGMMIQHRGTRGPYLKCIACNRTRSAPEVTV